MAKTLQVLVISENPLGQTTDYRLSVLVLLPRLERIDKDPVSPEERADALERIKVQLKYLSQALIVQLVRQNVHVCWLFSYIYVIPGA